MDRQTLIILRPLFRRAVREVGPSERVAFKDELILTMYLWAVAHDRPLSWACDREHYHSGLRPRRLPSISQFCRRVKTDRFQRYLQHLHDATTDRRRLGQLNFLDGKPLAVGNYSRDPDAKTGYGAGRIDKGYKLHAVVTADRRIASWSVLPLNVHEKNVAGQMIAEHPRLPPGVVFMADGNYDAHDLHKALAARAAWLYVKPRGHGEHPVTRRQMGAARRRLLQIWKTLPELAKRVYNQRVHVEGTLSNLTAYGGGLGPLPAFVRRLDRVRRWVGTKIVLYHLRLNQRLENAA